MFPSLVCVTTVQQSKYMVGVDKTNFIDRLANRLEMQQNIYTTIEKPYIKSYRLLRYLDRLSRHPDFPQSDQ